MTFTRATVDTSLEKQIIIGLITSKDFIIKIKDIIQLSYFQNDYNELIARWCMDYFRTYEEPPLKSIEDIYNANREKIGEDQSTIIRGILTEASKRYELEQEINVPYLIDNTIKYFKKRSIELLNGEIRYLLSKDATEEAEALILSFHKVSKLISEWINPFDEDEISEYFSHSDDVFFTFPGALGEFLGNFERGWLVGISAPFKRGKTFLAQEFGLIGFLSGLKVVFFSLEMTKKKMKERLYKRLTATSSLGDGEFEYPLFDCAKNQDGSCEMHQNKNSITLLDAEGVKPEYSSENPYRPCTFCRENPEFEEEYEKEVWYEMIKRPAHEPEYVRTQIKSLEEQFGDNFRFKAYPRFSANLSDIRKDLYILEQTEEFIPDIIIIDYADILKPEKDYLAGVEKEDRTWIALSQLAGERHALLVVPTQVNKEALDAVTLRQSHTARWVGKLGHIDVMLTMNQTEAEKAMGVMRIGMMAHRHKDFSDNTCMILQNLDLGQVNLDSEWR